ncbi:hypothetical protein BDF22DRAFT_687511 [Syncephalis plumigaleata]|nr:hypothetical protein BDF22DRAFT_687511 [Syncephalis plumigaleata]
MTASNKKARLTALPVELHDDIIRRLNWQTALQLMRTCRAFHALLGGKLKSSIWRRFYHKSFPPCDRECKLYLWLLSRQCGCSIEQAARIAPSQVDWPDLFHRRYMLEQNWRTGNSTRHVVTFPGISCETDAEVEERTGWWHGLILAASAAGCLLRHMQTHSDSLYLVENRPDATAVPLQFGEFQSFRMAPYSFVNKPHYVHINDQYVVVVAMLINPDEDVMCIWRWDDPKGQLLGHWTLPHGHDSIIVDLYGRWLLWMADGKSNAYQDTMQMPNLNTNTSTTTPQRPKDLFFIHDLSSPSRNEAVLSLEARAGCIHVQPNRGSGTGRINDEQIFIFLVDAKEDGSLYWEQWALYSQTTTHPQPRSPMRIRQGVVNIPISGNIDYIWTMRMAESDDDHIYTLAVQSNSKWEMNNRMKWIRPSADAPGNLIMGHGLLMIDAYEPEELVNSTTSTLFEPIASTNTMNGTPSSSLSSPHSSPSIEPNHAMPPMEHDPHNPMLDITNLLNSIIVGDQTMLASVWPANNSTLNTQTDYIAINEEEEGGVHPQQPLMPTSLAALPTTSNIVSPSATTTATTATTTATATASMSTSSSTATTNITGVQQTVIIDIRTGNTLYRSAPLADRNTMVVAGPLVLVNHRHRNRWRTFLIDVETGSHEENGFSRELHSSATHIPVIDKRRRLIIHDFSLQC